MSGRGQAAAAAASRWPDAVQLPKGTYVGTYRGEMYDIDIDQPVRVTPELAQAIARMLSAPGSYPGTTVRLPRAPKLERSYIGRTPRPPKVVSLDAARRRRA